MGAPIVAHKDRPVRILFRNLLPTGADGDLFLPVDSTVMGSGPRPTCHVDDDEPDLGRSAKADVQRSRQDAFC